MSIMLDPHLLLEVIFNFLAMILLGHYNWGVVKNMLKNCKQLTIMLAKHNSVLASTLSNIWMAVYD